MSGSQTDWRTGCFGVGLTCPSFQQFGGHFRIQVHLSKTCCESWPQTMELLSITGYSKGSVILTRIVRGTNDRVEKNQPPNNEQSKHFGEEQSATSIKLLVETGQTL